MPVFWYMQSLQRLVWKFRLKKPAAAVGCARNARVAPTSPLGHRQSQRALLGRNQHCAEQRHLEQDPFFTEGDTSCMCQLPTTAPPPLCRTSSCGCGCPLSCASASSCCFSASPREMLRQARMTADRGSNGVEWLPTRERQGGSGSGGSTPLLHARIAHLGLPWPPRQPLSPCRCHWWAR